jgi:hypothetical protein
MTSWVALTDSARPGSLFDPVYRTPRCHCVGKAWWQLIVILLTFAVTLIGVVAALVARVL